MITLAPISKQVQYTLNNKISMLKKSSGGGFGKDPEDDSKTVRTPPTFDIGTTITDEKGAPPENYMMTRVPFVKMTSFVPKTRDGLDAVVLMGGQLDNNGNLMGGFQATHGANQSPQEKDPTSPFQTSFKWVDNPHFRPNIPGMKDISVEYKGGGMMHGAHRTGDISWTCWNWNQLEDYTPHFLQHGNTILLEWGWSGIGALRDVQTIDIWNSTKTEIKFDTKKFNGNGKFNSLYEYLIDHINSQKGHYDAMLGIVTDFEYSVNDTGGFDCTTNIVASGVTMLARKQDHNINDKFSELPTLIKETRTPIKAKWGKDYWIDIAMIDATIGEKIADESSVNDKQLAELAPYVTFKDYMGNLEQECLSALFPEGDWGAGTDAVYDKDVPGKSPQIMVTTRIKNYKMWKLKMHDSTNAKTLPFKEEGTRARTNYIASNLHKAIPGVTGFMKGTEKWGDDNPSWLIGTLQPHEPDDIKFPEDHIRWRDRVIGSTQYGGDYSGRLKAAVGVYCTWGWFEDNVLSRFYGDVHEKGDEGGKTHTEFRSIERLVNTNGSFVYWNDTVDPTTEPTRKPVFVSTKMVNSQYLITTNTAKWIIPNPSDPIMSNLKFDYDFMEAAKARDGLGDATDTVIEEGGEGDLTKLWGTSGLHKQGEWVKHYFDDENFQVNGVEELENLEDVAKIAKSNKDEMCIRNILFHTEYLKKWFKHASEIEEKVMKLWADFSNEYGNVYKFVLDFDEDGNRMKVREEGFTEIKVAGLIESEQRKKLGKQSDGFPPLFTFPTWEDGSIVKSQTINAKLPDRMQQQALYANRSKYYGDQSVLEKSYSSLSAQAWGDLSSGTMTVDDEASESQQKQNRLADLMSGKVDYPSRGNRSFGSGTADIQRPLHVGKTPNFDDDEKSTTYGTYTDSQAPTGRGTRISDSIKEVLTTEVEAYLQQRKNDVVGQGTDRTHYRSDDAQVEAFLMAGAFKRMSAVGDKMLGGGAWGEGLGYVKGKTKSSVYTAVQGQGQDQTNWSMFYTFRQNNELEYNSYFWDYVTVDKITGDGFYATTEKVSELQGFTGDTFLVGHVELKRELMSTLHALLRGDENGVLEKQAPLLPIEMELEIDGTGGIFPGNSFHSSYLTDRYRERTVFQCLGSSHKIDSSGWSTTLTGKMRYIPNSAYSDSLKETYKKKPAEKYKKSTPPLQRPEKPYIPPSDEEAEILPDVNVEDITENEVIVDVPETYVPDKPVVLQGTFRGEVWQNMVIYGYEQTINSTGQMQWVQTGMHKPEWQPKYIFSDGSIKNFEVSMIGKIIDGQLVYRNETGTLHQKGASKTVRKDYYHENIEGFNKDGKSVGYDMLHADTLSIIY